MAQQRTKVQVSVGAQDTATDNLDAATSGTVTMLLVGATINEAKDIESGDYTVDVYHPGQLAVGHIVTVWKKTAGTMGTDTMDIASIVDNGSDYTITFNGITGTEPVAVVDGDRLTCTPIAAHRVGRYEQEIGGIASTSPIALDSSGQGSVWISSSNSDVDIYISGTGLTSRWFLDQRVGDNGVTWDYTDDETIMHNDLDLDGNDIKGVGAITMTGALAGGTTISVSSSVSSASVLTSATTVLGIAALDEVDVGALRGVAASVASGTTIALTDQATVIEITGTIDIETMTGCEEGRVVYLWFSSATPGDIIFNPSTSAAANEFLTPGGGNLSPVQFQCLQFVGVNIGGSIHMWLLISSEGL